MNDSKGLDLRRMAKFKNQFKIYIVFLIVIVIILLITINSVSKNNLDYTSSIKYTEHQQECSMRIVMLCEDLTQSTDRLIINNQSLDLKVAINNFESIHKGLVSGSWFLELPNRNSQKVSNLLELSKRSYDELCIATKQLLALTASNVDQKVLQVQQVDKENLLELIVKSQETYIQNMELVGKQYLQETISKSLTGKWICMSLILLILLVTTWVLTNIFYPMYKFFSKCVDELENSKTNLLKLFDITPTSQIIVDIFTLKIMYMNTDAYKLLKAKYSGEINFNSLFNSSQSANIILKLKTESHLRDFDTIILDLEGEQHDVLLSSSIIDFFGSTSILVNITDITKQRIAESNAKYDVLTGLLSRRSGLFQMNEIYSEAKQSKKKFIVCFLDINGLKFVNDTYGHEEGDEYIKNVAYAMKLNIYTADFAMRYGGDEFMFCLYDNNIEFARSILQVISDNLNSTQEKLNKPYTLSVSWGICGIDFAHEDVSLESIIVEADKRMYERKRIEKLNR